VAFPKIIYPSGGGTTLTFLTPARFVPYKVYEAVRHDNVASAGTRETVWERNDTFQEFEMEYVRSGSDIAAWDSFIQSALQGTTFDYYPDASLGSFTTYTLEDNTWNAAFKQLGIYTFKLRFRKRVPWP
jgi:hypothetical protein